MGEMAKVDEEVAKGSRDDENKLPTSTLQPASHLPPLAMVIPSLHMVLRV